MTGLPPISTIERGLVAADSFRGVPSRGAPSGGVPSRGVPVPGAGQATSASFAASLRAVEADDPVETARDAARQIVATALVQPVLALLRETSLGEGPFAPGAAERRFGPLLDQQIADRITRRASFPLVDRIARQLHPDGARNGPVESSFSAAATGAALDEGRRS